MTKKPTGLAAFTRQTPEPKPVAADVAGPRRRGQGETVALTVRLSRSDWERLHQFAVSEGVSLQALALRGLSHVFTGKGLPALKS